MIRADGEKLYASAGGLEGAALPRMLLATLQQAGRTFNDAEIKLLAEAIPKAEAAMERKDLIAAAAALKPLKPLGKLGDFKSYSALALRGDALAEKIAASGKQLLEMADAGLKDVDGVDVVKDPERLKQALTLVAAADAFEMFPELNAAATQTLRMVERNDALAPLISQARALERARGYAQLGSARFKSSAIKSYERILQRYTGTAVADIARSELAELDPESEMLVQSPAASTPPSNVSQPAGFRTWTDNTGQHKTVAKLVGVNQETVTLMRKDERRLVLPLEKLSTEDRKYLERLRGKTP